MSDNGSAGPLDRDVSAHSEGYEALWAWFGLSGASWLTLPRVLMHTMPDDWQRQMAALLHEYDATFPNQPPLGTRVQITTRNGKLTATPEWLIRYRYPDKRAIDRLRANANSATPPRNNTPD